MELKVLVCTPSVGQCKFTYSMSLCNMIGHFCTTQVFPECKQQQIEFAGIEGSGVSSARESFIDKALEGDYTHLLFIDEDMMFPNDALHRLLRWRQDMVGVNYRKKLPPGTWLAVSADEKERVETTEESKGLQEVTYTGFGFFLMSRKALEAVKPPRFLLQWLDDMNGYSTEDVVYMKKAREAGMKVYIDHDLSKEIGHLGTLDYRYGTDYSTIKTAFVLTDVDSARKAEEYRKLKAVA